MAGMIGFSVVWEDDGFLLMSPVYESKSKLKKEFPDLERTLKRGGRIVEHHPKNNLIFEKL